MAKKFRNISGDKLNVLEQLIASGQLDARAGEWLKGALDPYHDAELSLDGLPDRSDTRTVTQAIFQQVTISKPAAVTGNWDCHVSSYPFMGTQGGVVDLDGYNFNQGNGTVTAYSDGSWTGGYGAVTAVSVPAGAPTFIPAPGSTLVLDALSPTINGGRGGMRIIAAGFEVTNTTAPLNRQGSVTVYKTGDAVTRSSVSPGYSGATYNPREPCQMTHGKVSTLAQASIIPGSVSWAAEEGAYVPIPLLIEDQRFDLPFYDHALIGQQLDGSGIVQVLMKRDTLATNGDSDTNLFRTGMQNVGAYFSGLSPETTLHLTARFFVELSPSPQSVLGPMIKQPAPYSPIALELYSRIVAELPPGTQKGNNDAGDWFRNLGRTANKVLQNPAFNAVFDVVLPGSRPAREVLKNVLSKIPDERVFPRRPPKKVVAMSLAKQNIPTAQAKANLGNKK